MGDFMNVIFRSNYVAASADMEDNCEEAPHESSVADVDCCRICSRHAALLPARGNQPTRDRFY